MQMMALGGNSLLVYLHMTISPGWCQTRWSQLLSDIFQQKGPLDQKRNCALLDCVVFFTSILFAELYGRATALCL
jgi:hypothetical protein